MSPKSTSFSILFAVLTLSTSAFRLGEDAESVSSKSHTNATNSLCCAWRVQLGAELCEKDMEGRRKNCAWDWSGANKLCDGLRESKTYFLKMVTTNSFLGGEWSLSESCQCSGGKGYYGGQAHVVGNPLDGTVICKSGGPLGASHCKIDGRFTSACACVPAKMACTQNDDYLLFAPQTKQKGVVFNCGGWFDKNTAEAHYLAALQTGFEFHEDVFGKSSGQAIVDPEAKPTQKMIGSDGEEGWSAREKYGGQALADNSFFDICSAAPA